MGLLYVGNTLDDSISVICTERDKEIERIKLKGSALGPRRIIDAGGTLFFANSNASTVGFYCLKTAEQGSVGVGSYPIGLSEVKNKIFACCGESNSVWRIDAIEKKAELCANSGVFPISITSKGKSVYVSCLLSSEIIKLSPSLIIEKRTQLKLLCMHTLSLKSGFISCGLAGEGNGELVVLNNSLDVVSRRRLVSPVEFMALLPCGKKIAASNLWNNSISLIDLDKFGVVDCQTSKMPDQVVAVQDKIYVSCIMSDCIDVFSSDGKALRKIKVGREPRGIAVGKN